MASPSLAVDAVAASAALLAGSAGATAGSATGATVGGGAGGALLGVGFAFASTVSAVACSDATAAAAEFGPTEVLL